MNKVLDRFDLELCDAISVPPGYYFKQNPDGTWMMAASDSPNWCLLDNLDAKAFMDQDFTYMVKMAVKKRKPEILTIYQI